MTPDLDRLRPGGVTSGTDLTGRVPEFARLTALLQRARAGSGGALVLRGEAGVGKTALLDRAAAAAHEFRVVRLEGVQSEAELEFAGLQLLCSALTDVLARLPATSRGPIEAAFGAGGAGPDRLSLGLAVRELLRQASVRQPLLCIVEDAHWLDRATTQVLVFVARRIESDSVVMLLVDRESPSSADRSGPPVLALAGLSYAESCRLASELVRGAVDQSVMSRIVTECRGKPRLLREVLTGVAPVEFAGGFGPVASSATSDNCGAEVLAQIARLAEPARQSLLLAAADPTGDPALLLRAVDALAIPRDAVAELESHRLVRLSPRVAFEYPGLRAAAYEMASAEARRVVHGALAAATEEAAPEREVWHRALAAAAPDEALARDLELQAPTAQRRGGPAAAAAFLDRATQLSVDPAAQARRALAAAAGKLAVGQADVAARLLAVAEPESLEPQCRARHQRLRASVAFATRRSGAAELLTESACRLQSYDGIAARDALLEAVAAAVISGRHEAEGVRRMSHAAGLVGGSDGLDLLAEGLLVRLSDGYAGARDRLRDALGLLDGAAEPGNRWLWLASRVAADLYDDRACAALAATAVRTAEEAGAYSTLVSALGELATHEVHEGELAAAETLVRRAGELSGAAEPSCGPAGLLLAGWRGRERPASTQIDLARREARARGDRSVLTAADLAEAVLYNGLGRYEFALAAASNAVREDELALHGWGLAELVEAAARSGCGDRGLHAVRALSERAAAAGTDWALGLAARSQALVEDGDGAEALYVEAIDRLAQTRIKGQLARSRLMYGEWLRRRGRRVDAREQLRAATEAFTVMGAEAFAERARREHLATGEKVRRRSVEASGELTPQEAGIAVLARNGLTNPEIGERLFISARTVEYHLHKVFAKLGISSRRELHLVLDKAA